MEKVGVEIVFNDGRRDWIDQIDRDEAESAINAENSQVVFNNGHYNYEYERSEVKEFTIYELCLDCGWDSRDGNHGRDCSYNQQDED